MNAEDYASFVSHIYWDRKEQFALERDLYPHWTMFAVQDGRFIYAIADDEGEAGFGDLVVCPPHTSFHRRTVSPLSFHFLHFGLDTESPPASKTGEELRLTGKISLADTERLSSDLRYLKLLASERDRAAQAHKQHLLNDLLRLASLELAYLQDPAPAGIPPELQQAHQFMTAHAFAPLSMRNLADSLALSPVQLTRRFRAAYGVTPSEFVTELRLSRACRLLEETTLSIDKIASRCGYENGFYLSRVFRHKRGMTPSFYRKTHQV